MSHFCICEWEIISQFVLNFSLDIQSLSRVRLFYDSMDHWILLPGILQARILEQVAIPISRGSSQTRGWTHVSCTAGRFFTTGPPGMTPWTKLLCVWGFPGKNNGVGSHTFPQEIFLNQGSDPCLLNYRKTLYHLRHQGSPKVVLLCLNYCVKMHYLILYYSGGFTLLILFFSFYNFT